MSATKKVSLNAEEMKQFVMHIVENNRVLQQKGLNPVSVNIEGESGIGKTSAILQLAEEMKMDHHKLNLAMLEELGDLVGFPLKEYEVIKENKATDKPDQKVELVTRWVPESSIPMYIQSGYKPTGEKRMSHALPEWIQGRGESGFLILDDYTRADKRKRF